MYIPTAYMAIESLSQLQESAAGFINPNACDAKVEVEITTQIGQTVIAGTEIVCRGCKLIRGFEAVGTEQVVAQAVKGRVSDIIKEKCLKIGTLNGEIQSELMPQPTLRS